MVWRKNDTTYDLIGSSENLANSLVAGAFTTIDLSTPITGVQEGDYYGYYLQSSSAVNTFHARTGISGVTSLTLSH